MSLWLLLLFSFFVSPEKKVHNFAVTSIKATSAVLDYNSLYYCFSIHDAAYLWSGHGILKDHNGLSVYAETSQSCIISVYRHVNQQSILLQSWEQAKFNLLRKLPPVILEIILINVLLVCKRNINTLCHTLHQSSKTKKTLLLYATVFDRN